MTYGIIEINESKAFIGFVDTSEEFKEFIQKKYPDVIYMEDISLDDLRDDVSAEEGPYLIKLENHIYLVKKYMEHDVGFFSARSYYETSIECRWGLIECS